MTSDTVNNDTAKKALRKKPGPKKGTSNRKKLDPAERLADLEAEISRARTREEKRLIRAAEKSGYFRHRFGADKTAALFDQAIAALDPPRPSILAKLESKRARANKTIRAGDARRKAILGGFLVAQCRHRPELHGEITPDIRSFLESHHNAGVAVRNLALLDPFLTNPATLNGAEDGLDKKQEGRDRAHRLILLGAWVLERQQTRADIALLIVEELSCFIDQHKNAATNRLLLQDLLPEAKQT